MKKVVITGASGMIGNIVLQHCIASTEIAEIVSIVRKPSSTINAKVKEVVLDNFLDYKTIQNSLNNCDIAYFCIGVYTGAVPDAEFRTITVDYTIAFANAIKQYSPNATVCFLSGAGADRSEKSKVSFAKYKGIAENYLIATAFKQLYIFRPGYIYPVQKRKEPNLFYAFLRVIYPVIKPLIATQSVTSDVLGKVIFTKGLDGAAINTFENVDITKAYND